MQSLVAARIDRPVNSVAVRLIEIPTVSSELLAKAREETNAAPLNNENRAQEILTIGQLQSNYAQEVETILGALRLPSPATFVDYEVTNYSNAAPRINLIYLSEREIEPDAQALLVDDVRKRFENSEARVTFERLDAAPVSLTFERNRAQIEKRQTEVLDLFGVGLQKFASLRVEIAVSADRSEGADVAREREREIAAYLADRWKIEPDRVEFKANDSQKREASLRFTTTNYKAESITTRN